MVNEMDLKHLISRIFYKKFFIDKEENDLKNNDSSNQISKKNPSYINVLKIINNYFNN